MAKKIGQSLRDGVASESLREHLEAVRAAQPKPSSWAAVEDGFLRAMEVFDSHVIAGEAGEGERQNGKGDYFNDLIAALLEHSSGADLTKRTGVPGLIFDRHSLDVTYPPQGSIVEVLIEAKMLGTPKHPGSVKAKAFGRPGAADLLKRFKEAGFKTIDLKGGYGYKQSQANLAVQAGPSGDLTSWLRQAKPKSFILAAVRVVSESDFAAVVRVADSMQQAMDAVGLACYRPKGFDVDSLNPPAYEMVRVPRSVDINHVLHRISQDLRDAVRNVAERSADEDRVAGIETPAEAARKLTQGED
ncbi:hypothetical protein ACFFOU_11640 [Pseudonocardia sulfidoxydans]|uniref:hypothetical protein n=1 Tax=Pseudonocardia sulfidoxydans TaxID=54011 RepID=UPI0011BEE906|nr:hypothetical protein [Pseudonocardia sulfidoxydans]